MQPCFTMDAHDSHVAHVKAKRPHSFEERQSVANLLDRAERQTDSFLPLDPPTALLALDEARDALVLEERLVDDVDLEVVVLGVLDLVLPGRVDLVLRSVRGTVSVLFQVLILATREEEAPPG